MYATGKPHGGLEVSGVCCSDVASYDFLTSALLMLSPMLLRGVSECLCGAELPTVPTRVNLLQLVPLFFAVPVCLDFISQSLRSQRNTGSPHMTFGTQKESNNSLTTLAQRYLLG